LEYRAGVKNIAGIREGKWLQRNWKRSAGYRNSKTLQDYTAKVNEYECIIEMIDKKMMVMIDYSLLE